ncbi:MAG: hypothetical protein U0R18_16320 [Mycobacterium sp.]
MIKRWRFTIAAVVIAVIATLVYQFWYRRVPAECKPVQELLSFNSAQSKVIDEKTKDDQGLPNPDQLAAYTAWADGLADRAGKVTAPNLAQPAVELATLANKFVGKLELISSTPHAPGAPPPPEYYELTIINDQINEDIAQLKKACQR